MKKVITNKLCNELFFYLYLILYQYAARFDVMKKFKFFLRFWGELKKALMICDSCAVQFGCSNKATHDVRLCLVSKNFTKNGHFITFVCI